MKLKTYKEADKDRSVYLKLREKLNEVELIVVDNAGQPVKGGTILVIGQRGIHLCTSIDKKIGLPLGDYNTVKMSERR